MELEHEDTLLHRVRESGGHQHRVPGANLACAQRCEQPRTVVRRDHVGDVGEWHRLGEADADAGTGGRVDDVPRLGLAVREAEVATGELPIGMQVDRKALAQIEELHQHLDIGAVSGDVRRAQPRRGVRDDGIAQVAVAREHTQALGLLAEARGRRANPLLGTLGTSGSTAQ